MAIFGLETITFDKLRGKGPLAPLTESQYERTTLRYPMDLGNYDKGHYVVFYIREQITRFAGVSTNESRFESRALPGSKGALWNDTKAITGGRSGFISVGITNPERPLISDIPASFGGKITEQLNSAISKLPGGISSAMSSSTSSSVNNVFGQSNIVFDGNSSRSQETVDNSIKRVVGGSLAGLKNTVLTKDAIALYMPDTLQYSYQQSYEQMSIGDEIGGQVLAAGSSMIDQFQSGKNIGVGVLKAAGAAIASGARYAAEEGGKALAKAINSEKTGRVIMAKAMGSVKNPMLEMIYSSPQFRSFQFDFVFYPRDEKEALEVQRILERFRFHQAPEKLKSAAGFLIPPSEFDIRFYYAGAENPNIPGIATCILENIQINYAPNGFSAYEVPGEPAPALGRTGMPTAIQMALQFKETSYLTKEDFRDAVDSVKPAGSFVDTRSNPRK